MSSSAHFDGLFIATPERVSISYQLAGLGTRFVAVVFDTTLLLAALLVVAIATVATGLGGTTGTLVLVIASFLLFNGYFVFFEGLWSGQTPGKRIMRLRAVGEAGQPITFEQALMRNLVRNVDWLPLFYGVGIVALFANGRGKRLGDLAAGTVVVRERTGLTLARLLASSRLALERAPGAPEASAAGAAATAVYAGERALRDLDPVLRNLVIAYAGRRSLLPPAYREALAASARTGLESALPALVAEQGPLAALDRLADYAAARETTG